MLSVYGVLNTYRDNRDKIENYYNDPASNKDVKVAGMYIGLFMALFAIFIIMWIWAVIALIQNWKYMPTWAQVVGLLGVLPVVPIIGPVATLIVVYAHKPENSKQ